MDIYFFTDKNEQQAFVEFTIMEKISNKTTTNLEGSTDFGAMFAKM
jgi:hypothetical protein